jgi:uncharacterized RmlC-like cupin family protein
MVVMEIRVMDVGPVVAEEEEEEAGDQSRLRPLIASRVETIRLEEDEDATMIDVEGLRLNEKEIVLGVVGGKEIVEEVVGVVEVTCGAVDVETRAEAVAVLHNEEEEEVEVVAAVRHCLAAAAVEMK